MGKRVKTEEIRTAVVQEAVLTYPSLRPDQFSDWLHESRSRLGRGWERIFSCKIPGGRLRAYIITTRADDRVLSVRVELE